MKTFSHHWPIVKGIHCSPVNSVTKVNSAEFWYFLCEPGQPCEQTVELSMIWIIMTLVWGNSNAMLKLLPVRSFCEIQIVGMRWEEPQQPWTLLHKKRYIPSMLNWQTELKQCVGTRRMRLMYCYVPFYSRIQGNSHAGMLVTVNWITHITGCRYSLTFSYMRDMLHTHKAIFSRIIMLSSLYNM